SGPLGSMLNPAGPVILSVPAVQCNRVGSPERSSAATATVPPARLNTDRFVPTALGHTFSVLETASDPPPLSVKMPRPPGAVADPPMYTLVIVAVPAERAYVPVALGCAAIASVAA